VSNMLVTSCLDNICRIWIETVLPEDGLVNMNQFDPLASQNPKFRTHRHKHRFMQRLKHMKTCFHIRRHAKHHGGVAGMNGTVGAGFGGPGAGAGFGHSPIPTLPSTYSVHDFHSYGYHGTGITPGLHFHLAASINAETDIPLVPSMQTTDPSTQPNFILHWLDNKEMYFSLQAEAILQELTRKVIEKEEAQQMFHGADTSDPLSEHHDHESNAGPATAPHADELKKKLGKIHKSISQDDESKADDSHHHSHHAPPLHSTRSGHHSLSNTTSINSLAADSSVSALPGHQADSLDMKIEQLLRDWHHSPDLLFSIHPIDGSYLIWVVEWLDEYHPGSFRQAQISFSTRIPNAFPLGDAMSMSTDVSLYNTGGNLLHFRDMVIRGAKGEGSGGNNSHKEDAGGGAKGLDTPLPSVLEETEAEWTADGGEEDGGLHAAAANAAASTGPRKSVANAAAADGGQELHSDLLTAPPSPTISMVTKHTNGTLNLWQLTFADKSKFSQVLSIGHAARASGHRFRVNDITCHPVLPLLLTTSHHNIPEQQQQKEQKPSGGQSSENLSGLPRAQAHKDMGPLGFCSELILWRVEAVGPLSQSGGVSELARINSPEISAFSNVAWIPTLLPSTTLGSLSNSPSACFVASDGECLRVYQAVIDARTLLAEISSSERKSRIADSMMSLSTESSENMAAHQNPLHDKIKIVSQQSTARPGCIIQLDAIDDAIHDWQNTQLLHVFQEQLITGQRNVDVTVPNAAADFGASGPDSLAGLMESQLGAMVDLQRNADFEEPFYIVVLEKTTNGTTVHMWRIVIASQPNAGGNDMTESMLYVPDCNLVQDLDDNEMGRRFSTAPPGGFGGGGDGDDPTGPPLNESVPHISISTTKVCTQELPLPDGVDVVHASPAAGHLSSASIYPACFAPYIIVTACSDSTVRFWKCKVTKTDEVKNGELIEEC
jgi:DmX-like protein